MESADNVVLIPLAPAWFVRARQEDMRQVRLRRGYGGTSAVRPGRAMRPAHPANLAPVRHRADSRLGPLGLAGRLGAKGVRPPRREGISTVCGPKRCYYLATAAERMEANRYSSP